jgi:hypothetical protein
MNIVATLRKPGYLMLTCILTLAFSGLYYWLDMREGGLTTKLWTTHLTTPQFYLTKFGPLYLSAMLLLDVVIAFASSALLALAIDRVSAGRLTSQGAACTAGTAGFLGLATFGCPTCVMPIAGTFGALTMTKVMPLLGLEFKLLTLALVLIMGWWMMRPKDSSRLTPSFA